MTIPFSISDDEFYSFLDTAVKRLLEREDVDLRPGEKGRMYAWYWGYYGRAALDMYQATGEERFLHIVEWGINALLRDRDDFLGLVDEARGRVLPSWGTKHKNGVRSNEITTAGLIALPMLEYAELTDSPRVAEVAMQTLAAFKPERKTFEDRLYYFEHVAEGGVEAINHANVYGAALARASRLTNDPWYEETALGLLRFHMRFARMEGSGISWPYAPKPTDDFSLPTEAIWKAAASIELPLTLSELGMLPDLGLIDQIAATVSTHPAIQDGNFPQFLGHDRPSKVNPERVSPSLTSFIGAFLQIDNEELRSTIFTLMTRFPEFFPNGWKGGARAMPMAWAHLRKMGLL